MSGAIIRFGKEVGLILTLWARTVRVSTRIRLQSLGEQIGQLALSSTLLVGIASLFAGMVIALGSSGYLIRYGQKHLIPDLVSIAIVTELAPIFTALLMAGKAGAALASELGSLTLSGQAQAMRALSLDIDREIVAPRFWATVFGTIVLTVAGILLGLLGGMLLGSAKLGLSPVHYMNRAVMALAPLDFTLGLLKSAGFGLIIATFGCRFGLAPKEDAADLGRHTMRAVTFASFTILIADHVMTTLILAIFS